jgi:hypothetical protein
MSWPLPSHSHDGFPYLSWQHRARVHNPSIWHLAWPSVKMYHIVSEIDIWLTRLSCITATFIVNCISTYGCQCGVVSQRQVMPKCRPLHTDPSYYPYPPASELFIACRPRSWQHRNIEFHCAIHFHPVAICTAPSKIMLSSLSRRLRGQVKLRGTWESIRTPPPPCSPGGAGAKPITALRYLSLLIA